MLMLAFLFLISRWSWNKQERKKERESKKRSFWLRLWESCRFLFSLINYITFFSSEYVVFTVFLFSSLLFLLLYIYYEAFWGSRNNNNNNSFSKSSCIFMIYICVCCHWRQLSTTCCFQRNFSSSLFKLKFWVVLKL